MKLINVFSTSERPKVRSGGARRDRTADLLHAMQALSQLSYGPTMLEAEFYADVKDSPSVLCDIAMNIFRCERRSNATPQKQNAPTEVRAFCFLIGVPTGIRTPVATVKG